LATQYHIYGNGGSGGPVNFATPIATVSTLTWTSPALAASSAWRFAVRAFDTVTGQVSVTLDSSQRDISGLPPAPDGLGVTQNVLGGYRVTWHWPYPSDPTGFHVYLGSPTPNYALAVATVPATGKQHYRFDGTGLTSGTVYQVAVRAYNAVGEEANVVVASVTGNSTPPANVDALTATPTSRI
jgi:hypothetical protein